MRSKEIIPPKFLHDIHGSKTSLFDIILSYAGGVIAGVSVYLIYMSSEIDIPVWKLILMLVISADIGAGVVANFTKGTNTHYSGDTKKKTRLTFIFSHFLHPAVFFFALGILSIESIALVCFTIASTLIINSIKNYEKQKVVAPLLLVTGISLLLALNIDNAFLLWFFPLYMIKLFIAFGIRRYS